METNHIYKTQFKRGRYIERNERFYAVGYLQKRIQKFGSGKMGYRAAYDRENDNKAADLEHSPDRIG